jgi:hypothetical protein
MQNKAYFYAKEKVDTKIRHLNQRNEDADQWRTTR